MELTMRRLDGWQRRYAGGKREWTLSTYAYTHYRHSNVPVLHQNNTANITPEDFEDEHSDLFKLKAARRGKLTGNGVDFPLDPRLIQQAPPPAPEEPRDDQPDPRPQPCPVTPRAVTPSLPEEPRDDHPEPRPQPRPITCCAVTPTLPEELHDDQPEPHRHSSRPIMPTLPEEPQDGGQSNERAPLPSPSSELPHRNLEASIQREPQSQPPPASGAARCPALNSDNAQTTASKKRSKGSCAVGKAATVPGLDPVFEGDLSPITSPAPRKKKRANAAKRNEQTQGWNANDANAVRPQTRQHLKRSGRKQF